jgi:hypothetical protein
MQANPAKALNRKGKKVVTQKRSAAGRYRAGFRGISISVTGYETPKCRRLRDLGGLRSLLPK